MTCTLYQDHYNYFVEQTEEQKENSVGRILNSPCAKALATWVLMFQVVCTMGELGKEVICSQAVVQSIKGLVQRLIWATSL